MTETSTPANPFKTEALTGNKAALNGGHAGALANMLRAILKVKTGAERESYNPLNYSPDDFVSRQKVGAALNTKASNGLSATPGPIPSAAKSKQPLIIPLCGKT